MKTDIKLEDMVARLQKPGKDILQSLTPFKCNLWHHATGLAGELMEIDLAVGKADLKNIKEEAGDFIFYAQGIAAACGEVLYPDASVNVETMLAEGVLDRARNFMSFTEATEAVVDLVKKHVIYGKDFDPLKITDALIAALAFLKEDLAFYQLTMEEVIEHNKAKLAVRYNGFVYSDQAAKDRKDKQ